jgi:alkylation response protein AidB-like acyl-CoA dehydrogenase
MGHEPDARLPPEILEGAGSVRFRTLGVPEEFGGIELKPQTEVRTFALISEEVARGGSGLAAKLVQNKGLRAVAFFEGRMGEGGYFGVGHKGIFFGGA